jgi:hypothetical protein
VNAQGVLLACGLAGIALVVSTGCSSMDRDRSSTSTTTTPMSTRFTARQLCIEAGGTYSEGKCTPATSALSGKALCESRGGTYFEGGDYCEVPPIRSR